MLRWSETPYLCRMNPSVAQKQSLSSYAALAASLLASSAVQGQIVYTDINDTTVNTHLGQVDININNDTVPDFFLRLYKNAGALGKIDAIFIYPYDSVYGKVVGSAQAGFNYPFNLTPGYVVEDSISFNGTGANGSEGALSFRFDGQPYPNIEWSGAGDGFLGVRIRPDDAYRYGWIRVQVAADGESFTVKDMAFESSKDSMIYAGHLWMSRGEMWSQKIQSLAVDGGIRLSKPSSSEPLFVEVLGMDGALLTKAQWTDDQLFLPLVGVARTLVILQFHVEGMTVRRRLLLNN